MERPVNSVAQFLLLGVVHASIFAGVVVYTPRKASLLRLAAALPLAVLTRCIYLSGARFFTSTQLRVLGPLIWNHYLSLVDLMLITRVDAAELARLARHRGPAQPLWEALRLFFNLRRINTKWEVRGVSRPSKPQGRVQFVAWAALKTLLTSTAIDAILRLPPKPEPHLMAPGKETLYAFWNLSAEDAIVRLSVVLLFAVVASLSATCMYYLAATIMVATGMSEPDSWPPIFGPIASAHTVRGLWSQCWHQLLRNSVSVHGNFISDRILSLQHGTFLSRFARLFFPFLVSGALHWVMEVEMDGLEKGRFGVVTFFLLQPLGIMLEGAIQALVGQSLPKSLRYVIGYTWVAAWFWWSMAPFGYEQYRTNPPPDMAPIPVVYFAQQWFGKSNK
ncbi:unnamed protein product [Clonostachys rhizophaga]|uniref:Wax synthase domain-containing protein n=1 Tax=Clonostachys rhizophaga TaxID=160324 RepID=A0A9N9W767_9HYPO|nr:unnamed protein product [Clonostachys rhizophaga]